MRSFSKPFIKIWNEWPLRFLFNRYFWWSFDKSNWRLSSSSLNQNICIRLHKGVLIPWGVWFNFLLFEWIFNFDSAHVDLRDLALLIRLSNSHHVTCGLIHNVVIYFSRLSQLLDALGESRLPLNFWNESLNFAGIVPELLTIRHLTSRRKSRLTIYSFCQIQWWHLMYNRFVHRRLINRWLLPKPLAPVCVQYGILFRRPRGIIPQPLLLGTECPLLTSFLYKRGEFLDHFGLRSARANTHDGLIAVHVLIGQLEHPDYLFVLLDLGFGLLLVKVFVHW